MQIADEMGAAIEAAWLRHRLDEAAFPQLVCERLSEFSLHEHITPDEIVRWFTEARPSCLPRQINIEATFGEPPITLYAGSHFYMEALFWLDGTTSIHQHGFSGAFQVLAGSSLHSTYRFERAERVSSRMVLGELRHEGSELLERGAVRPIHAGPRFIHSLFHLERPSLSLVVRTYNEPDAQPQWNYQGAHIGVDPFFKPEWLARLLQLLDMLHRSDSPELVPAVERTVRRADFFSAWSVLRQFLVLRPNAEEELDRLLAAAREVHGERVDRFRPVLAEIRRQHHIALRRSQVRGAEHRFFLAMLLNLPSQELVFDLVRRRFPGQDPVALILRWVRELAALEAPGAEAGNPLGFDFGDEELEVLRHLLLGRAPREIVEVIAREYDVGDAGGEIVALAEALRGSLLFGPLFRRAEPLERAA